MLLWVTPARDFMPVYSWLAAFFLPHPFTTPPPSPLTYNVHYVRLRLNWTVCTVLKSNIGLKQLIKVVVTTAEYSIA